MKLLDRSLFFAYIRAYLIVLVCLLSLYVILDLFTNLEDFAQHVHGFSAILHHIGRYYGYRVLQYFDRLCEAITLLAAMFTVAWIQRNNELMPLLSAGVPTRRARSVSRSLPRVTPPPSRRCSTRRPSTGRPTSTWSPRTGAAEPSDRQTMPPSSR